MATVDVYDIKKQKVGELELSDDVFNGDVKEYLIHEAVKVQLANRRAGTACTKNRTEVSGGGQKPYKQKGTGQARQGSSRAPNHVGGGTVFGPTPRSYDIRMNKKARKAALRSILALLYKENKLTVFNALDLDAISTKSFAGVLKSFDLDKTLIVIDGQNTNLELSARNIKNVKVLKSEGLNPHDMMKYRNLIFTEASVKKVEGALS